MITVTDTGMSNHDTSTRSNTQSQEITRAIEAITADPDVTDFACRLWVFMSTRPDHGAGLSIDDLVSATSGSRGKVDRAIRCLKDAGWVTRRRRGFSNFIDTTLLFTPKRGGTE